MGLKRIVEAFPDAVIRQDEEGRTPLHILCTDSGAFADAVAVLIEPMADLSKASLHSRDAYSNSFIDLMSAYGALSADLLQNIVEKSSIVATVELKDTHGPDCNEFGRGHVMKLADEYITPLHWLCAQPDLTMQALELLMVGAGSAAARVDSRGQTPLHYLCKNKAAVSHEMLALFQRLNEDPVSSIDSKEVLLSQTSAEAVVTSANAKWFPEPSAGDAARSLLNTMLTDQASNTKAKHKQKTQKERERRNAVKAEAKPNVRGAVSQKQKLVDHRARNSAKALRNTQKERKPRMGLVGASFGKPLPRPRTVPKGKQHRSFPEPRAPVVQFMRAEQRPGRPKSPREHHSMAHIIAGMPDGAPVPTKPRGKGGYRYKGTQREVPTVVDWATADNSGTTALHLLCTDPTSKSWELLRWAASTAAVTDAWSVTNRAGRTPLDVLQFTSKSRTEARGADQTEVLYRLTSRRLKELVLLSNGRLAKVPLRSLEDPPVDMMEQPARPGDMTLLAMACTDLKVTEQDLADIVYAYPDALMCVSGVPQRNPLQMLCANPRARPAHISCLVRAPHGREATAAQDVDGNNALHLLCQNTTAVCEESCAALVAEYTQAISVQNRWGRLPIHYAAALGANSVGATQGLLLLLSEAPRALGRKRPKRGRVHVGVGPTRDVFGRTPLEHLARNGTVDARLVNEVGGRGALSVSRGERTDALVGESPFGAVDALISCK